MNIPYQNIYIIVQNNPSNLDWGLFFNALTAIGTCVLAYVGYKGLNSWQQSLKYYKEKIKIDKLQDLYDVILKLDDVYKRLNPSYKEIPTLLNDIDKLRKNITSDNKLLTALNDFNSLYWLINHYLITLNDSGNKKSAEISESSKKELDKIQSIVQDLILKIPPKSEELKTLIKKELE
jgi:hypothetical protein